MNKSMLSLLLTLSHRQKRLLVLAVVGVLAVAVFNGLVMSVDMAGWSSGFIHPLHGGDHFLTMLAVGIWAAQLRGKAIWLLPLTFVGVMSLGGLAGAAGLFIPNAEPIILLSALVFSVFVVRKIRFSSQINVGIVAFFAFFHGFAHGQEISTSASLISYTLGFMLATLLLHGAGILVAKLIVLVFALLLSHLVHAQSSLSHDTVKFTTASTQSDKSYQVFIADYPAPPDLLYRQQIEDGGGTVSTNSSGSKDWLSLQRVSISSVDVLSRDMAHADLFINTQLGIRFLNSGVGLTAPPVALVFDSLPRCCFTAVFSYLARLGSLVVLTNRYANFIPSLAIHFLSNGVGITSPPVWRVFVVVASLSLLFRIIPAVYCTANSKNFLTIRTRSRSPPAFAFRADL